MATSLSGIVSAMQLSAKMSNLAAAGSPAHASLSAEYTHSFATGTGADQGDRFWYNTYTILDTVQKDVDLSDFNAEDVGAGVGEDHLGLPITLVDITALMIKVESTSVGSLLVGGEGSANEWISLFNSVAGAVLGPFPVDSAFYVVVPTDPALAVGASNRLLQLEATGGDIDVTVALLGRSA